MDRGSILFRVGLLLLPDLSNVSDSVPENWEGPVTFGVGQKIRF